MKYSIIVPVYNAERYLEKCLHSLISQSVASALYEVLLVDDGSTDASEEICRRFASSYENVEYYRKTNGGPSSARNYGLNEASGEYVAFVDADDWVEPDFLESVDRTVSDRDFLIHGYFIETTSATEIRNPNGFFGKKTDGRTFSDRVMELDADSFFSAPWIGVFKRSIIQDYALTFNEELSFGEDTCFVFDYLFRIDNLVCLGKPLYHYNNTNAASITKKYIANRYPLCLVRFREREKIYRVFGTTGKAKTQFCRLLTVETNNCVRNVLLKQDCDVKIEAENILGILNDDYIKRYYGKRAFSYRKCGASFFLSVLYLKTARLFRSKALIRLFSKMCIRRLNKK